MDYGTGGMLAYTVDSQGLVLRVQEASRSLDAAQREDRRPASPQGLVSSLTWEPLQRLLSWGAREGMTAAELLDSCRAATRPPTTRRRRNAR